MNDAGRKTILLLTGIGIGFGLAVLFAPQSGEETREWLGDTAAQNLYMLRRRSRRSMKRMLDIGEEKLTDILRGGKDVFASVAAKLD
ncbi:MAG TPA: YtxH domain-containing protein [Candidatus Acidoferrales bacterium]